MRSPWVQICSTMVHRSPCDTRSSSTEWEVRDMASEQSARVRDASLSESTVEDVAHALAHDCTVVTHEVPADTIRKIKIPNACIGLGLRFTSPYEMLRRERARFVLGLGREVT